ncbi:MAG: hypothetical protein ACYC6N_20915 [Pirellulaceae bacterium]
MRGNVWCLVAVGILLSSCAEQPADQSRAATAGRLQGRPMPPPPPVPAAKESIANGSLAGRGSMQIPVAPSGSLPPPGADTVRIQAEAGVGVKGQRLDDKGAINRMIVTPALALFRTEQRLVFEIQVPHAMQLYEATHGKKPATHDEFMEQIIRANQIVLPELPAGQRYVYDPETGELMVEKPAG